jgi:S-adenosylmethionine-diacylgycerolhomoserine-N-methlytransferase
MSFVKDVKTLYQLIFASKRGKTHSDRLEHFYKQQADDYDRFRQKLLHGREELYGRIDVPEDGVWLEMGGGTGFNLEAIHDQIPKLKKVYIVDLSPSLLSIAQNRVETRGWQNVSPVIGDATTYIPPEGSADVVTFSYSLTMIPDWFAAVERAIATLKPGGTLAVVDFYVSRKHNLGDLQTHGWFTRSFWPVWFATDNVFLNPDHLAFLEHKLERQFLSQNRGKVPFLPFAKAPYYLFIGRKP